MLYLADVEEGLVTRCCTFRLDPNGFVRATMHDGATFDLNDARDAIAATWQIAGERRLPVLVDMRGVRAQTREAREYFMSEDAAAKLRAVALVAASPIAKVLGNFFIHIGEHKIPTQIFTDRDSAEAWLREHLA